MHRLFVAIRPPREVRDLLCSVMGGIPGARWQSEDQLHLTLRFIGNVDGAQGDDIATALAHVRASRFTLTLQGAGTFDRRGRIHTLWAGIQPSEPLERLHRRVDRTLDTITPEAQKRAYTPHLTLARFSSSQCPTGALHLPIIPSTTFEVESFWLFESILNREGASYLMIERYELD
jgi:2'-5' RNA ligase